MRVAVIGAGAAGLVTARELLAEGAEPVILDRNDRLGGTWIYDEHRGSLYASLRTNLPRDLMAFDALPFVDQGGGDPRRFPGHPEVLRYLHSYAERFSLHEHLRPRATVTDIRPLSGGPSTDWQVRWLEPNGSNDEPEKEQRFDAVAVCNGHYHEPRIPELPGLDRFTGRWLHSHAYREPGPFAGLTVALLGAKSSGIDLSHELASVARRVILCARDQLHDSGAGPHGNLDRRPAIAQVLPHGLRLSDGTEEHGVDALVLCTGYHYSFPFLDPAAGLLDAIPERVFPLYLDLVAARASTVAFVGLPFQVVPFPLCELQARLWARTLTGRATLPDAPAREQHAHLREARFAAAGVPRRHRLRYGPAQYPYCADLAALAGEPPPPSWRARLNALVAAERRRDPVGYRDAPFPTAAELGD